MKTVLLSMLLAASVVTTAGAASAKHARHHHHHAGRVAQSGTASNTDWPGNPYMDLKQSQVNRFWHDAFDPYDATAK